MRINMRKVIPIFLLIFLCVFAVSCGQTPRLRTNPAMQAELDAYVPGDGPKYYPPDKQVPPPCTGEHSPLRWVDTGPCHYRMCGKCGKILIPEEPHSVASVAREGYSVINGRAYVISVSKCQCHVVIHETYIPIEEAEGEVGQ